MAARRRTRRAAESKRSAMPTPTDTLNALLGAPPAQPQGGPISAPSGGTLPLPGAAGPAAAKPAARRSEKPAGAKASGKSGKGSDEALLDNLLKE
jgi:hypothetical protein